jgi:hypothetical protein
MTETHPLTLPFSFIIRPAVPHEVKHPLEGLVLDLNRAIPDQSCNATHQAKFGAVTVELGVVDSLAVGRNLILT